MADVTKQYLYQLAYDDFIAKQGYKYVQNMFFFVLMNLEIKNMDGCRWDMLHQIGDKKLEDVAVVKLCASEMYSLYLADHIVNENEMDKYIPVIGRHEVDSQNFANRMMAYLTRITTASKLAEKKLEMKSDRGRLIYPKQIKENWVQKLYMMLYAPLQVMLFMDLIHMKKRTMKVWWQRIWEILIIVAVRLRMLLLR